MRDRPWPTPDAAAPRQVSSWRSDLVSAAPLLAAAAIVVVLAALL